MASKGLIAVLNGLKALRAASESSKDLPMAAFLGVVKKYAGAFIMGALKDYTLGGFLPVDQLVTAFITNYVDKATELFPVSKKWDVIEKLEAKIQTEAKLQKDMPPHLPVTAPVKPAPPKPLKPAIPPTEVDPNGPI